MVFTYNARADKSASDLVVQSQVYAGSKLYYASPVIKLNLPLGADPARIPYAARISLAAFDLGNYELKLVVIDRATKETANRRVNFSVE